MKRGCAIGALLLCACAVERGAEPDASVGRPPDLPGLPGLSDGTQPPPPPHEDVALLGASCDPTRAVAADSRALLVQDGEVLERIPLERVLRQIIQTGSGDLTPLEMLQRVFDTENATTNAVFTDVTHCDQLPAHERVECPRVEGRLASSSALLRAGDPDSFEPIALVNRFDLIPSDRSSCGEYRIVYAKRSGRTDPNDRVFLILEGALENPGFVPAQTLAPCRPVAELWASLASLQDITVVADRLEHFFFEGSDDLLPLVHGKNYGLGARGPCEYASGCGQLRVGQGMQDPWRFRQFRLPLPGDLFRRAFHGFEPVTVTGSPPPELFDGTISIGPGEAFRDTFLNQLLTPLRGDDLSRVRLLTLPSFEGFESSVDGNSRPDYVASAAHGGDSNMFGLSIQRELDRDQSACPARDPLTTAAILRRASMSSCAGCHAPDELLPPDRAVGCGKVWPASLGRTHIDENGTLSEALTQVFLPHRAQVLSTYLRACDAPAVVANLEPRAPDFIIECFVAGTLISMADGSQKAIEQIVAGEEVLAFDSAIDQVVPSYVERAVIRPHADRLITINGALVATANHPFYTGRGLKRADRLELGDELVELQHAGTSQVSAAPRAVRQLVLSPASVEAYNLEVARYHNYFANGLLVHDRP
jgi:hypothetical protein